MLKWRVAAAIERGCHRKTNDDHFFISRDKLSLMAVAASAVDCSSVQELFYAPETYAPGRH